MNFTVDSALLKELGELLVEKAYIAAVELIKNSYDADATEVEIKIIKKKDFSIQVKDNGTGMTLAQLEKYWMRIATTHKEKKNTSDLFGRVRTGAKGIGRFCCRRLGDHLSIESRGAISKTKIEKTDVVFDWKRFTPGSDVTIIECPGKTKTVESQDTGVTLLITGGSAAEWNEGAIDLLKRKLAAFAINRGTRRRGFEEDPGFSIKVAVDDGEFEELSDLREQVYDASWGLVTGQVDSEGRAHYLLEALGVGKKSYISKPEFKGLRGTKIKFGLFPDRRNHLRNPRLIPNYNIRQITDEWGGIQVRHHGMRVFPYGDDDWLDIDKDRSLSKSATSEQNLISLARNLGRRLDPGRALLSLLSMKGYVGEVELAEGLQGFQPKISREGFIDSSQLDLLKRFTRLAVDWSTIYRDMFVRNEAERRLKEITEKIEKLTGIKVQGEDMVSKALKFVDYELAQIDDHVPKKVAETISLVKDYIQQFEKRSRDELRQLRMIASASSLLLMFAHEIRGILGLIDSATVHLEKLGHEGSTSALKLAKSLKFSKNRLETLVDLTILMGTEGRTEKPKILDIRHHIETAIECFSSLLNKYEIEASIECEQGITVGPLYEAELYSILLNGLSNAVKAVVASNRKRQIRFVVKKETDFVRLNVLDTGVGMNEQYFKDVFLPFVTDPAEELYGALETKIDQQDLFVLGKGSGLGLTIVQAIVLDRKGDVFFKAPKGPWKTDLEIRLP
jgi:signal transduction histidine kinase